MLNNETAVSKRQYENGFTSVDATGKRAAKSGAATEKVRSLT